MELQKEYSRPWILFCCQCMKASLFFPSLSACKTDDAIASMHLSRPRKSANNELISGICDSEQF